MTASNLLQQVRDNFMEAGIDQLEAWNGLLSIEFAFLAQAIGECKKDRALAELDIKKRLLESGEKFTEKEIERQYYASSQGQFLALNQEYIKAIGKLLTAVRYKAEALKGKI